MYNTVLAFFRVIATLAIAIHLANCTGDKSKSKGGEEGSEQGEVHKEVMSSKNYARLAKLAQQGDASAAYELFQACTYDAHNYGLAYFWCMKAKSLGHPDVTEREIRIAEDNVLSEASSYKDCGEAVEPEDLLPK